MKVVYGQSITGRKNNAVTSLSRWLGVRHNTVHYGTRQRTFGGRVDESLALVFREFIDLWPMLAVRKVWVVLKFGLGRFINRKPVTRLMRLIDCKVRRRRQLGRPLVKVPRSVTESSDQRWPTDITIVLGGKNGCRSFVPVVDRCTREVLGKDKSLTALAKTAEQAPLQALLNRLVDFKRNGWPSVSSRQRPSLRLSDVKRNRSRIWVDAVIHHIANPSDIRTGGATLPVL